MTYECKEAPRLLQFVSEAEFSGRLQTVSESARAWVAAHHFNAERGKILILPADVGGEPASVWVGLGSGTVDLALMQSLPDRLLAGTYRLEESVPAQWVSLAALGFALGAYRFSRYKKVAPPGVKLQLPPGFDAHDSELTARADALARDLINTPAQDLGPTQLSAAVAEVATRHGARCEVISGDGLLAAGYPAVHAVGRSGAQPPSLVTLRAGVTGPLVALVGKGVCFDSGGLNLKPTSGMALMKKDMGGAAVALALADLLLGLRLPIRLLVVIPAVENGVGPEAFRPGDVLATRQGLTVEVTNTDAEGRLVLADALTRAAEDKPDLIIDFATLTGAARVALGPELPAAYASDPALTQALAEAAHAAADPLWPMPLWSGYEDDLQSKIADLQNASASGFAGSITAALFLRRFVPPGQAWIHLDLYAWNPKERPGRPLGAEAQTLRAVAEFLRRRYMPT